MKHRFFLPITGALLFLACSKSPSAGNTPTPSDTVHHHQDTLYLGGNDTATKGGGDTTGKTSVTKIFDTNGWSITLDQKTQAVHEMQGSGLVAVEIMDPTDTGAIRAEFINLDKGSFALSHSQYGGDTIWSYLFSNINHFSQGHETIDTTGKLAVHVYRADRQDVRAGMKDIYFYLNDFPNPGIVGNGTISFGPFRGDTSVISTTWLAAKIAAQKYYFRRFDTLP